MMLQKAYRNNNSLCFMYVNNNQKIMRVFVFVSVLLLLVLVVVCIGDVDAKHSPYEKLSKQFKQARKKIKKLHEALTPEQRAKLEEEHGHHFKAAHRGYMKSLGLDAEGNEVVEEVNNKNNGGPEAVETPSNSVPIAGLKFPHLHINDDDDDNEHEEL
eukprot:PhM_4_TR4904/c0_g1_i1/m.45015